MKVLGPSVCILILLTTGAVAGDFFPVKDTSAVIGKIESYTVSTGESLHEAALKTGMGFNELADANPGVDPWNPGEGTALVIPKLWVLPDAPFEGIVINLAEMRLYRYTVTGSGKVVETYPVGIGREAFDTPEGVYKVTEKLKDPYWTVPESVREEDPSMPHVMPPGGNNPLGKYALRLSNPQYLIHGTNRPLGIGRRVSRGCIRMYPEDIAKLYASVKPGTPVRIVYQPVKAGLRDGAVYVEVQGPANESIGMWEEAVSVLERRRLLGMTDSTLLFRALQKRTGVPVPVTAKETTSPQQ